MYSLLWNTNMICNYLWDIVGILVIKKIRNQELSSPTDKNKMDLNVTILLTILFQSIPVFFLRKKLIWISFFL